MIREFILRNLSPQSKLYRFLRRSYRLAVDLISLRLPRRTISRLINKSGIFEDRYISEDFGFTVLYTNQANLFPDYPFRETLTGPRTPVQVTLISTLKNEAQNVRQWMEFIFRQTRLPDEIVIVDGGSSDGTYETLIELKAHSPVPLHIIQSPGVNISAGRNQAIERAANPIIAATDFGCRPEPDWLENLIAPFEKDPEMQVAGGWYLAEDRQGRLIHRWSWPTLDLVDPWNFIPSSRSIAFTKSVWKEANGYPEWLTLTGEDTYFALELRRFSSRRAFVPDAVIHWFAPDTPTAYWKKVFNWSVGDGESGLQGYIYLHYAKRILTGLLIAAAALVLLIVGLLANLPGIPVAAGLAFAFLLGYFLWFSRKSKTSIPDMLVNLVGVGYQVAGFIKGTKRRAQIDQRRFQGTRGIYFVLAGVPIHDTGGGSRGAQIALELLRQNYLVVYIHQYESYESIDLKIKIRHPNLLVYRLDRFSWMKFTGLYAGLLSTKKCRALIEFPLKEFLPVIDQLRSVSTVICYDLLDAWNSQLGSAWYDKGVEHQVIDSSQVLIATAPNLVDYLEKESGRPVAYLPNAVNRRLFDPHKAYVPPDDLVRGSVTIVYIGALWGEWFDWDLLGEIARSYPDAAVNVIGDYLGQYSAVVPNLHFLGLKPQKQLPAYLSYTDVAIIPWKKNEITYATSPLKLYEYLAMNVPVVVPDLPPLKNIPYVYLSSNSQEFTQNIQLALKLPVDGSSIDEFIRYHTWQWRIKQLTDLVDCVPFPAGADRSDEHQNTSVVVE